MTNETDKTSAILYEISSTLKARCGNMGKICGKADKQEEYFYPEKWKKCFSDNKLILSDLNAILKTISECEGRDVCCEKEIIRRRHVFKMANEVKKANGAKVEKLRRVFLAAIIWGRGTRGKRGMECVKKIMEDYERFSDALIISYCYVKSGCIEEAYDVFSRSKQLPGLGQSFFTKYLYFIGRDRKLRPLILDGYVTDELKCEREGKIVWNLLTDYAKERRTKSGEMDKFRYIGYIKGVDGCVKKLQEKCPEIEPDDIEIFLWKKRGKDPQP